MRTSKTKGRKAPCLHDASGIGEAMAILDTDDPPYKGCDCADKEPEKAAFEKLAKALGWKL